jgi:hypothetical protein
MAFRECFTSSSGMRNGTHTALSRIGSNGGLPSVLPSQLVRPNSQLALTFINARARKKTPICDTSSIITTDSNLPVKEYSSCSIAYSKPKTTTVRFISCIRVEKNQPERYASLYRGPERTKPKNSFWSVSRDPEVLATFVEECWRRAVIATRMPKSSPSLLLFKEREKREKSSIRDMRSTSSSAKIAHEACIASLQLLRVGHYKLNFLSCIHPLPYLLKIFHSHWNLEY